MKSIRSGSFPFSPVNHSLEAGTIDLEAQGSTNFLFLGYQTHLKWREKFLL
jgi:hypothetical protein